MYDADFEDDLDIDTSLLELPDVPSLEFTLTDADIDGSFELELDGSGFFDSTPATSAPAAPPSPALFEPPVASTPVMMAGMVPSAPAPRPVYGPANPVSSSTNRANEMAGGYPNRNDPSRINFSVTTEGFNLLCQVVEQAKAELVKMAERGQTPHRYASIFRIELAPADTGPTGKRPPYKLGVQGLGDWQGVIKPAEGTMPSATPTGFQPAGLPTTPSVGAFSTLAAAAPPAAPSVPSTSRIEAPATPSLSSVLFPS